MAKKEKVNPIIGFEEKKVDLIKFDVLSDADQYKEIETILKDIYQENLEITRKLVLKVMKVTLNPKDNYTFLPFDLKVSKEGLTLSFTLEKQKKVSFGWVVFMIWLFIFALIGATYYGIQYMSIADLNKDIDGDKIADINIDINNDRKAEINIDTNNDKKPDINIDYKANRRSVFNIDTDNDGKADSNLVNDATDKTKTCTINCDLDGDGWPDINLDLDGDGIPDTDVDKDNDRIADLNLDVNGDGVCDIMCDTDNDKLCDQGCINTSEPGKQNGSSTVSGNPSTEQSTPLLLINYVDGVTVNVSNLFPDDQPAMPPEYIKRPLKSFTIENLSDYPIIFSLKWKITYNTFETDNLKFQMTSTNGGATLGRTTVPKKDQTIAKNIVIGPRVSQKYTITFNLEGNNTPQNIDQGKIFQGTIEAEV